MGVGQQATQSCHAAFQFAYEHAVLFRHWFEESTYLVLLTVADEAALAAYELLFERHDLVSSTWHEPDMGDELTAIAVEPSPLAARYLSSLPLTGREGVRFSADGPPVPHPTMPFLDTPYPSLARRSRVKASP